MTSYQTEQEVFWAGQFGDDYIERNNSESLLTRKIVLWGSILKSTNGVKSIKEFGCNIGLNLLAMKRLQPNLELSGIEINEKAAEQARALNVAAITQGSIINPLEEANTVDLAFTAGVLIHINPEVLPQVYDNLCRVSKRYVLICEYYNPTPVTVSYRGNQDRLFKRDFAGEMMDRHSLKLVDYGFVYKRDNWAPQDDFNWFLLEK